MSNYMPTIRVFIDGESVDVQLAQGDFVRAERDGFSFGEDMTMKGNAMASVAYHALCRAKRKGLVAIDIPETFEDFLDAYELPDDDQPEETDPKGSAPDQPTGA